MPVKGASLDVVVPSSSSLVFLSSDGSELLHVARRRQVLELTTYPWNLHMCEQDDDE